MTDAEVACRHIFRTMRAKAAECSFELNIPSEEVCTDAIAVDEAALRDDCLPYLRGIPCEGEMTTEEFRAHCAKAVTIKLW
jgi:hypothetical protein